MRDSILYYPHIEIPDTNWLKSALLLWENVYRIVPTSYHPSDSDEVKSAVDAGLVRSIKLERQDLVGVTKKFEKFLKNLPFSPAGLEVGQSSQLHPEKVDATLYPLLDRYTKGESADGWIELPREIVRGYMFFLSTQVAKRRKLDRATDSQEAYAISGYFSERANLQENLYDKDAAGLYSSLMFEDLLPNGIEGIPIEKILKIADATRDERRVFRESLIEFAEHLRNCESQEYAMTVLADHKKKLIFAKNQLKSSQGFLGKEERGSLLTMGVPVALTAYGGLVSAGSNPYGINTISSSILIGAMAAYADYKKVLAMGKNPYGAAYLVTLDRRFCGTDTYPAYDRYLNEFIND